MGSSGSSEDTQKTTRFAPYIEEHHASFLDLTHSKTMGIIDDSPYGGYTPVEIDTAFFCIGNSISNFPSLYDMYGKFMAGFDVEILWGYVFVDSLTSPEINTSISEEMKLVDDNIIKNTLPEFQIMMRDINSVASSSFVIGKSAIENGRVKTLSKISSEAKFQMIPSVQERFNSSLSWAKKTITTYAESMKLYYMTKMGVDKINYEFDTQNKLWPFNVLDFEGVSLGTMRRGMGYQKTIERRTRSDISKVLLVSSYTLNGALIGSYFGPWGTVIGVFVGFAVGIAILFLE